MDPTNLKNQEESDNINLSRDETEDENSAPNNPENADDSLSELIYNPFAASGDAADIVADVRENTLVDRIYPFADNRPICECDTVRCMTSNPDVRYLLSLLPDMAEMNETQKSVFRYRVIQALNETFSTQIENKPPNSKASV